MGEILQLDYYYGIEAEQFSFYRVPRLLIKDERFKKLSSDAKLLYCYGSFSEKSQIRTAPFFISFFKKKETNKWAFLQHQ